MYPHGISSNRRRLLPRFEPGLAAIRAFSTSALDRAHACWMPWCWPTASTSRREVAARVDDPTTPEIRALVEDLADTLVYWRTSTGYGRGIAAPQIGVGLRVIFLQLPAEQGGPKPEPWPLVNPEITWKSDETIV